MVDKRFRAAQANGATAEFGRGVDHCQAAQNGPTETIAAIRAGLQRVIDMDNQSNLIQRIELARSSDTNDRGNLLNSYRNYLRMLAQTWLDSGLNGKVDHSDLVQETLLKAHERFEQFQGASEAELAGWLRSILARHLADIARRYRGASRQLSRERSLEEVLGSTSMAFGQIVAKTCATPSEVASQREAAVVLADALAELPDDYRDVIMWISLEEQDWDTVAQRMGRSAGAVRMLWARALKQLQPLIQEKLKGPS